MRELPAFSSLNPIPYTPNPKPCSAGCSHTRCCMSSPGSCQSVARNLLQHNSARSARASRDGTKNDQVRERMEIKSRPGGEKTLGQILVEKGIIRQEQLDQALMIKAEQPGKYLGEILFEIGVPQEKINRALYYFNKRKTIGEILVDQKLITREQLE